MVMIQFLLTDEQIQLRFREQIQVRLVPGTIQDRAVCETL